MKKIVLMLSVAAVAAAIPTGVLRGRTALAEPAVLKLDEKTARLDDQGRVTIPEALRKQAGLTPGTELELEWNGQEIVLRKKLKLEKTASGLEYADVVV